MAPARPLGRLAREDEFRRVYREGARRTTPLVTIHAHVTGGRHVRLGLAVGRRFGGAVARNRLRRRLREAVRAHRGRFVTGADLVIAPRPVARDAPFADLQAAVRAALEAAGLVDPEAAAGRPR